MARRPRQKDPVELIFPVGGAVLLVCLIFSGGRQLFSAISFIAISLSILAVLGIVFLVAFKITKPSAPEKDHPSQKFFPATNGSTGQPIGTSLTTAQLIEKLRAIDWYQFEKIVAIVYRKAGFKVDRRGGANPDGGIDIMLTDSVGERTAIQSKQWKTWNVGVKTIREFLGALTDAGIQKGIVITLRGYTGDAKRLAEKHGIELVNETGLAELLESIDARFDPEVLQLLNDDRKLCPKCERELILRTATKGTNSGDQFWGCSAYPRCRFTMLFAG